MPPKLALILTLGFIAYLFRRDIREKPNITYALWIPVIWSFLVTTRSVSKWLHILGLPGFTATSVEEGSSLDAIVFLSLIVAGWFVLSRRRVNLTEFARDNPWLMVFVVYCFLAIFWADLPLVSFKRWIKILGHPIMVLIIFTEPQPREALVRVMKRCAYVLLPISILWMKYYPALGRASSDWGGMSNCGVSVGKNAFGVMSSILFLIFLWYLLHVWRWEKDRKRRNEILLNLGLLLMAGYCVLKAHSATSTISLMIAVLVMLFVGLQSVKRLVGAYVLLGIVILIIGQLTFDIYGRVADASGHESTLAGRGRLWEVLLQTDTNPIIGAGFESYWLGERVGRIWSMPEFRWHPTQAHNGYLEIYLNLGIVGLMLLAGWIISTFGKIRLNLLKDFEWGRIQMALLVAILFHNWTEAGFKGLSFPFFIFFIIAINRPALRVSPLGPTVEDSGPEESAELVLHVGEGVA